jgi:AraC-like DNA-binding protein
MDYFSGVEILHGEITPRCTATIDSRWPGFYSVEFMRAGRMYFGLDGGPRHETRSPTVFWHHPVHRYQYGPLDKNGWDHRYVTLRGPMAKRLLEEGFMRLRPEGFLGVRQPELIEGHFRRAITLSRVKGSRRHGEIFLELEAVLCLLQAQEAERISKDSPHAEPVLALARRMSREPGEAYALENEAERAGLSYSHFRRLFHQLTGEAPHEYLLRQRIFAAAEALRARAVPLHELAPALGFADPIHFLKAFKKRMGLTPGEYRRTLS